MPTIAVVGRPNVGKSLLFNRLARKDVALVHDRPGVTRDTIATDCWWHGRLVTLLDTGGVAPGAGGEIDEMVRREAGFAIEAADVLLWVVDARAGRHPVDESLAHILRRAKKPIVLAANKADEPDATYAEHEFRSLGFGDAIPVSAAHGHGVRDVVDALLRVIGPAPADADGPPAKGGRPLRWAVVGRPNVGKSSLVNTIVGRPRTLVAAIPGTTRDAIEVPLPSAGMTLVDTAGMRKRARISDTLETQMTARTVHAINRADLCVLLLDAGDGVLEQDRKIAGIIQSAEKPVIIAINKWDLPRTQLWRPPVDARLNRAPPFRRLFEQAVRADLFFITHAPLAIVSARTGEGIAELIESVEAMARTLKTPIATPRLNKLIHDAMQRHPPPMRRGKHFRIYYAVARQEADSWKPPSILAFCNDHRLLDESWRAFLENSLREDLRLGGCPILWRWRSRREGPDAPDRL